MKKNLMWAGVVAVFFLGACGEPVRPKENEKTRYEITSGSTRTKGAVYSMDMQLGQGQKGLKGKNFETSGVRSTGMTSK